METTKRYGIQGKKLGKAGLFYMSNGQVAMSSSVGRRFWARLLDFIFSAIIGSIIFMSFYYTGGVETASSSNVLVEGWEQALQAGSTNWQDYFYTFDNYMHTAYNPYFLASVIVPMFGMIFFNIGFPLINPKHKGQSLGKMILKITPIFETNKNIAWTIVKREMPLSLFQVLILITLAIVGVNSNFMAMQYKQWYESIQNSELAVVIPELENPLDLYNAVVPYYRNIWHFITEIAPNSAYVASNAFNTSQVAFAYIGQMLSISWTLILLILFISIALGPNKRGLHDQFAHTAVVDLRTLQSEENFEMLVEKKINLKPKKIENHNPINLEINNAIK